MYEALKNKWPLRMFLHFIYFNQYNMYYKKNWDGDVNCWGLNDKFKQLKSYNGFEKYVLYFVSNVVNQLI